MDLPNGVPKSSEFSRDFYTGTPWRRRVQRFALLDVELSTSRAQDRALDFAGAHCMLVELWHEVINKA